MKSIDELEPSIRTACELVQQNTKGKQAPFGGPIVPSWLPVAIPQFGERRSHMDSVIQNVLVEVLGAYLPNRNGQVFWRGPAYQINRTELAQRFDCDVGDISTALTFLEKHNLIQRTHRANIREGEYAGKAAFVVPNVPAILAMLNDAKCRSTALHPTQKGTSGDPSEELESPLKDTQGGTQADVSPKCAQVRTKAAEVGASEASRPASAKHGAATATASAAFGAPEAQRNNNGAQPGPTPQAAPTVELEQAGQFLVLWKEAIQRSGHVDPYEVSTRDEDAVLGFFTKHPRFNPGRLVSYAILAWLVSKGEPEPKSDPFYRCRRSFKIGDFFHHLSDIQAELRRANKVKDVYPVLRWFFMDCELEELGLGQLVLDNLGRDRNPKNFWENHNPDHFKRYYTDHGLPVPETVAATNRQNL